MGWFEEALAVGGRGFSCRALESRGVLRRQLARQAGVSTHRPGRSADRVAGRRAGASRAALSVHDSSASGAALTCTCTWAMRGERAAWV